MSREQTAHLQASMFCADRPTQSLHPSIPSEGGPSPSGPPGPPSSAPQGQRTGAACVQSLSFPSSSDGKESTCNAGDPGSIPGSGRSPGEAIGYPIQYSCLENSMDRGAWWDTVHGATEKITKTKIYFGGYRFIHTRNISTLLHLYSSKKISLNYKHSDLLKFMNVFFP